MNVTSKTKKEVFVKTIKSLQKNYTLVTMGEHAKELENTKLKNKSIKLANQI